VVAGIRKETLPECRQDIQDIDLCGRWWKQWKPESSLEVVLTTFLRSIWYGSDCVSLSARHQQVEQDRTIECVLIWVYIGEVNHLKVKVMNQLYNSLVTQRLRRDWKSRRYWIVSNMKRERKSPMKHFQESIWPMEKRYRSGIIVFHRVDDLN
jgi:hypothetical protein